MGKICALSTCIWVGIYVFHPESTWEVTLGLLRLSWRPEASSQSDTFTLKALSAATEKV